MAAHTRDRARRPSAPRDWKAEYARLSARDRQHALEPAELERLAIAAYLAGHESDSIDIQTRVHNAALESGDTRQAARSAFWIFEGGNIVSDTEHVLIGANTMRRNAIELDVAEPEVVLRFEEELGRRVLVVGPVPQPVAHIDMMLTPLGGGRAAYPMLTYNNVLVEEDARGRVVYLPRYGWAAMDESARQAWESLGFATRPIDGLTISAMYGGALRCAVKVLAR